MKKNDVIYEYMKSQFNRNATKDGLFKLKESPGRVRITIINDLFGRSVDFQFNQVTGKDFSFIGYRSNRKGLFTYEIYEVMDFMSFGRIATTDEIQTLQQHIDNYLKWVFEPGTYSAGLIL